MAVSSCGGGEVGASRRVVPLRTAGAVGGAKQAEGSLVLSDRTRFKSTHSWWVAQSVWKLRWGGEGREIQLLLRRRSAAPIPDERKHLRLLSRNFDINLPDGAFLAVPLLVGLPSHPLNTRLACLHLHQFCRSQYVYLPLDEFFVGRGGEGVDTKVD